MALVKKRQAHTWKNIGDIKQDVLLFDFFKDNLLEYVLYYFRTCIETEILLHVDYRI